MDRETVSLPAGALVSQPHRVVDDPSAWPGAGAERDQRPRGSRRCCSSSGPRPQPPRPGPAPRGGGAVEIPQPRRARLAQPRALRPLGTGQRDGPAGAFQTEARRGAGRPPAAHARDRCARVLPRPGHGRGPAASGSLPRRRRPARSHKAAGPFDKQPVAGRIGRAISPIARSKRSAATSGRCRCRFPGGPGQPPDSLGVALSGSAGELLGDLQGWRSCPG